MALSFLIRKRLFWRHVLSCVLACGSSVVLVVAGVVLLPRDTVGGFTIIAFVFYACAIWIPVLSLVASVRGARNSDRLLTQLAATLSIAVALFALFVEPNRLTERRDVIQIDGWSADAPPLTIAHISDLQTVGQCSREAEAAKRINAAQPDFIVFTGDYAAGPWWNPDPAIAAARSFLQALRPKIATVVVMGHSERESIRTRVFEGLDLVYLVNAQETFELESDRTVSFHGIHSWPGREDLSTLKAPRSNRELRVCVSHVPDLITELQEFDLDLHLAGHTHGGQIVIPGFGPPITLSHLPREFARGLHRFGNHWLNVSAGIGMEGNHAPRIRLFCPPEISFLEVRGRGD